MIDNDDNDDDDDDDYDCIIMYTSVCNYSD